MIILFSFLVFLFVLYIHSRDDFTFLRRNLTLEKLFDIVFLSTGVGLIFSRIAYVVFHPSSSYINPLVFLLVPYFPGLSLSGFLLGSITSVYMIAVRGKLPIGRLYDIVSLACLFAFATYGLLEAGFLLWQKEMLLAAISLGISILGFVWYVIARQISLAVAWRDGLLALATLLLISVLTLIFQSASLSLQRIPPESVIFLILLLVFAIGYSVQFVRRARQS